MKNLKHFLKTNFVLLLLLPAFLSLEAGENDTLKVYYQYQPLRNQSIGAFQDSLFNDLRQYYEDFRTLYGKKYVEEVFLQQGAFDSIKNNGEIGIKISNTWMRNFVYDVSYVGGCGFGTPVRFYFITKIEFCDKKSNHMYVAQYAKDRQRSLEVQKRYLMGDWEYNFEEKKYVLHGEEKLTSTLSLLKNKFARQYPQLESVEWLGNSSNSNRAEKRNKENLLVLTHPNEKCYLFDSYSRKVFTILDISLLEKK
ncbi:MAG: hypothetical protein ACPGXL_04695 [Chitinophagales bacterium]